MTTKKIAIYGIYLAIFLFMGLTPYIGFITVGPISITLMFIPLIIMTMHLKVAGGIVGGFLFGLVAMLRIIIMPDPISNLLGLGWSTLAFFVTRVILGLALGLSMHLLMKVKWNLFVKTLIITLVALTLNLFMVLGAIALHPVTGNLWILFGLSAVNISVEWPVTIVIAIAMLPLIKHLWLEKNNGWD